MSTPIDRYPVVIVTSIAIGLGGGALAWIDCGDARALAGGLIGCATGLFVGAILKWSAGIVYLLIWPPLADATNVGFPRFRRIVGILGRVIGVLFFTVILHEAHWIINIANLFNVGLELASDFHRAQAEEVNNALMAMMGGAPRQQPLGEKEPMVVRPSVYSARPLRWLVRDQGHTIIDTHTLVKQLGPNAKPDPAQLASWIEFVRQLPEGQKMTLREQDELTATPRVTGTIVVAHLTVEEMRSVLERTWLIRRIPDVDKLLKGLEKDFSGR